MEEYKMEIPSSSEMAQELEREKHKVRFRKTLRSTICTLVVVAAISVLIASVFMPVLKIYGTAMKPTINDGEVVLSLKRSEINKGDICAFYYGNKLLVKRVIALSGEMVDIDLEGNVYVNGQVLNEPYINKKALGECDIQLPYKVPDDRYFVMEDNRKKSQDSRNSAIGCVSKEQLVGRIVFRVWPLKEFGKLE